MASVINVKTLLNNDSLSFETLYLDDNIKKGSGSSKPNVMGQVEKESFCVHLN